MAEEKETIGQYIGKLEKRNKLLNKKIKAFETVIKAQSKMIEELSEQQCEFQSTSIPCEVTMKKLIEENEHFKKSQEWHDISVLPTINGEYLCQFSNGVYNYRFFTLPNVWCIDDEKIIKWQGEL